MTRQGEVSGQVASNMTALRKAHGLSQEALAAKLAAIGSSLTRLGIGNVETRGRAVSVDELVALAEVFNVEPAALLTPVTITYEVRCVPVVKP